jgi:hypothetical protein
MTRRHTTRVVVSRHWPNLKLPVHAWKSCCRTPFLQCSFLSLLSHSWNLSWHALLTLRVLSIRLCPYCPAQSRRFPAQSHCFPAQSRRFPTQPHHFPAQSRRFPAQSRRFPTQSRRFPAQSRHFPVLTSQFLVHLLRNGPLPLSITLTAPTLLQVR